MKKILLFFVYSASALSLPLLLVLYQKIAGQSWQQIFTWHPWPLISLPKIVFYQSYNFPLDFIHNIGQNKAWIIITLTILTWLLILKKHKYLFFQKHLVLFSLLVSNYILARIFISFDNQIEYEQNAYLLRIIYLIALTILPIFLSTWYFWWEKYLTDKKFTIQKFWLIAFTMIFISSSFYFSYPLYDRHSNSKSFNITKDDLDTVNLIEQASQEKPYIVLANQMLGAAAIKNFGFKAYYNNNFYYSMPLGNDNIYRNFINMIEKQASREEAILAMDKAGVNKLYFIVNDYWHSAKTSLAQAELSADDYFVIGQNHVFIYNR